MYRLAFVLALLLASGTALAHSGPAVPEPMDLHTLTTTFGWDLDTAEITTEKVADDLYVLFGIGGNIAVNIGEDGVFAVDDQFPQLMPKILDAVKDIGGDGIDFVVNTHWHFDHAEGNLALGPAGTLLVAQENSREMMQEDRVINLVLAAYLQEAYPPEALPDITFGDAMQFHLNGQTIDLWHFGPAHTTGDAAIYFRGTNAIHLGDVYNNTGYPFIDAGNGGSIDGIIRFCNKALRKINKDTVVIPGHGPIVGYDELAEYTETLTIIRDRILALIEEDATLEEVYAAKPTAEFDKKMGDPTGFINRAYMSLTHRIIR